MKKIHQIITQAYVSNSSCLLLSLIISYKIYFKQNVVCMDKILKSNEKYLIVKSFDKNYKAIVYKYDLRRKPKIIKEFKKINSLRVENNFYNDHLVPVSNLSKDNKWGFKNLYKYKMPFIEGNSYSLVLRDKKIDYSIKAELTSFLYKKFSKVVLKKKIEKKYIQYSWENQAKILINNLYKVDYLSNFLESSFYINGNYIDAPIKRLLDFFRKKNKMFFYEKNIHGNFHGENIIVTDLKRFNKFKIIDPDCSLKKVDPSFSLARFLYTFIHDSVEYKKYNIYLNSKDFEIRNFSYKYIWDKNTVDSYELLDSIIIDLIEHFDTDYDANRLFKSFIHCLLIGAIANDNGIKFTNYKSNKIKINCNSYFILFKVFEYINKLELKY